MDVISTILVIAGVLIALAFNFSNGRNDAANTIATVVATHALSPRKAIIMRDRRAPRNKMDKVKKAPVAPAAKPAEQK